MPNTTSWSFPNMLDPVRNAVNIAEDSNSIVNRTRLLILTEPTELYNSPNQGVGLKRYLWQYNTENTKARIQDRIKEQLRIHEPSVDAEETSFSDGLLFTGSTDPIESTQDFNRLKFTVGVQTIYGDSLDIELDDLQAVIDNANTSYANMN